jgi:chromosome segregation ATPase
MNIATIAETTNTGITDILLRDLVTTQKDIDVLLPKITQLDTTLQNTINISNVSKDISENLSTLDDSLNATKAVLLAFSALPVVGSACSTAKTVVSTLQNSVHPVRVKANQFEAKVKPVRDKLQSLQEKVDKLIKTLKTLKKTVKQMYDAVDSVNQCVISKDNPDDLRQPLDSFSAGVDAGVQELNRVLEATIQLSEKIASVLKQLEETLSFVKSVGDDINAAMNKLDVLNQMLKPINSALNHKISITYSFKVKVNSSNWYAPWDWQWKKQNFSFTVQQIIDGINTGFDEVNDQFMKLAKETLDSINVDFPKLPSIPGLNQLNKKFDELMTPLTQVIGQIDSFEKQVDQVFERMQALEVSLSKFNVTCQ